LSIKISKSVALRVWGYVASELWVGTAERKVGNGVPSQITYQMDF